MTVFESCHLCCFDASKRNASCEKRRRGEAMEGNHGLRHCVLCASPYRRNVDVFSIIYLCKCLTDLSELGHKACESTTLPCSGPCLCQYLLAAHCACNWGLTFVSWKVQVSLKSSSLCVEFGSTPFQPQYPNTGMILSESLLSGTGWNSDTLQFHTLT